MIRHIIITIFIFTYCGSILPSMLETEAAQEALFQSGDLPTLATTVVGLTELQKDITQAGEKLGTLTSTTFNDEKTKLNIYLDASVTTFNKITALLKRAIARTDLTADQQKTLWFLSKITEEFVDHMANILVPMQPTHAANPKAGL